MCTYTPTLGSLHNYTSDIHQHIDIFITTHTKFCYMQSLFQLFPDHLSWRYFLLQQGWPRPSVTSQNVTSWSRHVTITNQFVTGITLRGAVTSQLVRNCNMTVTKNHRDGHLAIPVLQHRLILNRLINWCEFRFRSSVRIIC